MENGFFTLLTEGTAISSTWVNPKLLEHHPNTLATDFFNSVAGTLQLASLINGLFDSQQCSQKRVVPPLPNFHLNNSWKWAELSCMPLQICDILVLLLPKFGVLMSQYLVLKTVAQRASDSKLFFYGRSIPYIFKFSL
ncbi:hypothetical protein M9H77_17283 [Catharanthus roseus]|uniref:Uncharacterized protein n=1 Tax=Catharanthus roseus TaxID=4058 RepID=A0ACC0B445_CATRO|nr:hypothetical protein M9H77_17283 [Catharanthus roseus]